MHQRIGPCLRFSCLTSGVFVVGEVVVSHEGLHRSHIRDFGRIATEYFCPWCEFVGYVGSCRRKLRWGGSHEMVRFGINSRIASPVLGRSSQPTVDWIDVKLTHSFHTIKNVSHKLRSECVGERANECASAASITEQANEWAVRANEQTDEWMVQCFTRRFLNLNHSKI